ncbi:MAG: restriction endonuclease [Methanosphaera stadtmanae]|nr:restriction endonuclease [Methanosphaera stadtmanae]
MDKERLINFVATIMEDSGFKVMKNYTVSNHVIDIYGILETRNGTSSVVVACKNYEEPWKIGIDVLKEMENVAKLVNASKIMIFTTSSYKHGAAVYAQRRNIKLVDRKGIIRIAKNYANNRTVIEEDTDDYEYYEPEYYEPINSKPASLNPHSTSYNGNSNGNTRSIFAGRLGRFSGTTSSNYHNTLSNTSRRSMSTRNNKPGINININDIISFFKGHTLVFMILLVVISALISYLLSSITRGPFTGIGKIVASAIVCYGGMLLINRDLSDVLAKGSILFFISIIISILSTI